MGRYETRPFTADCLDDAAQLRAADHRRHRAAMPALDPAFESRDVVQPEIAVLLEQERASGVLVSVSGQPVAYVVGGPRADPRWGSNVYVEDVGSAGNDPEAIREGYAVRLTIGSKPGFTNHVVIVNAADRDPDRGVVQPQLRQAARPRLARAGEPRVSAATSRRRDHQAEGTKAIFQPLPSWVVSYQDMSGLHRRSRSFQFRATRKL